MCENSVNPIWKCGIPGIPEFSPLRCPIGDILRHAQTGFSGFYKSPQALPSPIYIYTHTYMHACMHTYIQTDRQTDIHTYTHTYTHTHTYIHTYTHTCIITYDQLYPIDHYITKIKIILDLYTLIWYMIYVLNPLYYIYVTIIHIPHFSSGHPVVSAKAWWSYGDSQLDGQWKNLAGWRGVPPWLREPPHFFDIRKLSMKPSSYDPQINGNPLWTVADKLWCSRGLYSPIWFSTSILGCTVQVITGYLTILARFISRLMWMFTTIQP